MRAVGLAVDMPKPARPVVHFVIFDDPHGPGDAAVLADVTHFDAFDLKTAEPEWSDIAYQYFQDVSARVSTVAPDIVVIRRAGVYKRGRIGDGPRLRLVVEGAVTAAARSHVPNTHLRTGADCATRYGASQDVLDADGAALANHKNSAAAAAAALSGLFGNRS